MPEEFEQSLKIFAKCLGVENCAIVFGQHQDTDNPHGHAMLVRIDTVTGARVEAGQGWDIDAGHRAKAVIENAFPRWHREAGSQYRVEGDRLVHTETKKDVGNANDPSSWARRRTRAQRDETLDTQLDEQSTQYERDTGYKSRSRIALEIAVVAAKQAKNWDQAHRALASEGMELVRNRSGIAFVIDGKKVNGSIDRETSLKALERRYKADFEPRDPHVTVATIAPRLVNPQNEKRARYHEDRRAHLAGVTDVVANYSVGIADRVLRKAVATQLAGAMSFPSYDEWLRGMRAEPPVITAASELDVPSMTANGAEHDVSVTATAGFTSRALRGRVIYRPADDPTGRPAFVDFGERVLVYAHHDPDAVRASLLILAQRFPENRVMVHSRDKRFRELVFKIANEEGVRLDGDLGKRQDAQHDTETRVAEVAPIVRPSTKAVVVRHQLIQTWQSLHDDPNVDSVAAADAIRRDPDAVRELANEDANTRAEIDRQADQHAKRIALRRQASRTAGRDM